MLADTFLHGDRTRWVDAPSDVRRWVIGHIGELVADPIDCLGGMSTGIAAVVHGEAGAGFVKATDAADNPAGADLYRAEASIATMLPPHQAIPSLIDDRSIRIGSSRWETLLFEARPGSSPRHPWSAADLDQVMTAWLGLRPELSAVPCSRSAQLSDTFTGWREIAADPDEPWHQLARKWVDRELWLTERVDGGGEAVPSHVDLRADNVLLDGSGQVSFLDWAHLGLAGPWVDVAILLADVVASGADRNDGGEIDVLERFAALEPDADPELAVATIAATGAFLHVRAHRERVDPAWPHRHRWMAAASEQLLPFIERHTR